MSRVPICFLLGILILILGLILTDSPIMRYQKYTCQYQLIYKTKPSQESLEFLAIGGSKFLSAFSNKHFMEAFGRPIEIFNIGRSWRGVDQIYGMVEDALGVHKVKNLIVLFQPSYPITTRRYHPNFFLTARLSTLFEVIMFDTQYKNFLFRFGIFMNLSLKRLVWHLGNVLSGDLKINFVSKEKLEFNDCTKGNDVVPSAAMTSYEKFEKGGIKILKIPLTGDDQSLNNKYYLKLKKMIEEQGGRIFFLQLPFAYGALTDQSFSNNFEKIFSSKPISLSSEIVEKLFKPGMYSDKYHMTDEGARIYSIWLADKIKGLINEN